MITIEAIESLTDFVDFRLASVEASRASWAVFLDKTNLGKQGKVLWLPPSRTSLFFLLYALYVL